jgi:hypothetical protein
MILCDSCDGVPLKLNLKTAGSAVYHNRSNELLSPLSFKGQSDSVNALKGTVA